MTLVPIDYSKCIIYKIVCKDLDICECYIGHTTNFTRRKIEHKSRCNTKTSEHYNQHKYKFIRDNGGWDNWDMIEIEKFCCNDSNEAKARERYWIEQIGTLNKTLPNRTRKEYYELNKEQIIEKQRKKHNCPCGGKYTTEHLSSHKKSIKHQKYLQTLT